jgi:hypothetical protein
MNRLFASVICAFALGAPVAQASGPVAYVAPAEDTLEEAVSAWRRGDWPRVRELLEPGLDDGGSFGDAATTETALRHLADATLLDSALDPGLRQSQATEYMQRLLAKDVEWRPPPDTHSPEFDQLLEQVRQAERDRLAESCSVERTSCEAKLEVLRVDHDDLQARHTKLETDFKEEMVEVQRVTSKNRLVALVPFGVGHFYNGKPGFGAGFLAVEAAFGATGLALLLTRTLRYNCVRERGFTEGSLVCQPPDVVKDKLGKEGTENRIEDVRNAEQTFGILFIGALVADVIIAQVTFEKYSVISTEMKKRSELDEETGAAQPKKRGRRGRKKTSAKIRPTFGPGNVGLHIRF